MKRFITHLSMLAAVAVLATGCAPTRHNLPPEQHLMQPGPGVGGPGPGVMGSPQYGGGPSMYGQPGGQPHFGQYGVNKVSGEFGMPSAPIPGTEMPGGDSLKLAMAASAPSKSSGSGVMQASFSSCGPECQGCNSGGCFGDPGVGSQIPAGGGFMDAGMMMDGGMGIGGGAATTAQVTFGRPEGMQVRYDQSGSGMFDSEPLIVPARQNFPQGALYRVKLTNIPNREGVELYPTIELAYANPRTGAYLAHNSIPIQFTEEDFDQVVTGNFVTKVIYLPDPDFQGPALAGIDTLVSTRLDPGIDPIVEADRRGSILAIIRLGDKDIEMPGTARLGMGAGGGMMGPPIAGLPAPFAPAMTEGCGGPFEGGMGAGGGPGCSPTPPQLPGMIAGVNAPQYGMPITGTPIGLPGPPHIPMGAPAGLTKHVMRNHTPMNIPRPVDKLRIDVKQQPGYSYPNPVRRVRITEQNIHPGVPAGRGLYQHSSQAVDPNCQP
ncbi:MAG: hypothetical protein WBD20_09170 [Pirellulaceae bacterium]